MPPKNLLLRCDSLYEALDRYLDRELTTWQRLLSRGHLMMCPTCRAYLEQYRKVREITDQTSKEELPADFEEVMQRVVGRWRDPSNS